MKWVGGQFGLSRSFLIAAMRLTTEVLPPIWRSGILSSWMATRSPVSMSHTGEPEAPGSVT